MPKPSPHLTLHLAFLAPGDRLRGAVPRGSHEFTHTMRESTQLAAKRFRDAPLMRSKVAPETTLGPPKLVNHSVIGDEDQALNRRMEVSGRNAQTDSPSTRTGFGPDVGRDI